MWDENETIIKKPELAWFCGVLFFIWFIIKAITYDLSGFKYYGNLWDVANAYLVYDIYKGRLITAKKILLIVIGLAVVNFLLGVSGIFKVATFSIFENAGVSDYAGTLFIHLIIYGGLYLYIDNFLNKENLTFASKPAQPINATNKKTFMKKYTRDFGLVDGSIDVKDITLEESELLGLEKDLEEIEKNWDLATSYYPDIQNTVKKLNKLSKTLEGKFKFEIYKSKDFENHKEMGFEILSEFLRDHFGLKKYQGIGFSLLKQNKNAAVELNRALRFFGEKIDQNKVIEGIQNKFKNLKLDDEQELEKNLLDYLDLNSEPPLGEIEKDEEEFKKNSEFEDSTSTKANNSKQHQTTPNKNQDFQQTFVLTIGGIFILAMVLIIAINHNSPPKKSTKNNVSNSISTTTKSTTLQGEKKYTNGVYTGSLKNGQRHGQGTMIWTSGDKYVGQYINDKMHGKGTHTWKSGHKYIGEWKNGKKHGQGTYTWADGTKYVGQYINDKMHGQGTYTWADGTRDVGEFKDDKFHGIGTRFNKNGLPIKSGRWANDKFQGNF